MTLYKEAFHEADYRIRMLNLIRREKFDLILPEVMKNNKADMWIHVIRRGSNDPFSVDFGTNNGYVVFTDRGQGGIERALFDYDFGEIADMTLFHVSGGLDDLKNYIKKHDPSQIAVNMSGLYSHCDGLSYTGFNELEKILQIDVANKLVSSEKLLTEFRSRRVKSEIILAANNFEIQRRVMEKVYRSIVPGKTSLAELGIYGHSELINEGIRVNDIVIESPYVVHSETSTPDQFDKSSYILQKGDFIVWDWGTDRVHMNFGTDFKRHAYLLKEDEKEIPQGLERAWQEGKRVREILCQTIKSGKTVKETLDHVVEAIEEGGFVYTPYTDTEKDREIIQSLGNTDKIGFSIDSHCVGNSGNSEVALGPSIAPFRKERFSQTIYPNILISFEFMINIWIPEWNERINLNFEDNALITELGVESLYPQNNKIITIK